MDNFDKIIKQKVEQFEVPYNEAHWAEMDKKLNSIRSAKIKKTVLGSAAVVVVVAISGYFIATDNETKVIKDNVVVSDNNTTEVVIDEVMGTEKENFAVANDSKLISEDDNSGENVSEENNVADVVEENNNENKVNNNDPIIKENVTPVFNEKSTDINAVNAEFVVYNNKVCLGEEVSFESSKNDQPVSYTWNFGDGTISHKANPKHVYKDSHVYTVSLTLLNRQTGKEYTTIQEDVVTILPTPKINFTYSEQSLKHDKNKLEYPYTAFNVKEENKNYKYKWSFGNGESEDGATGRTIFEKAGSYSTTLIATDKTNGCSNILEKKIVINDGIDLFPPTGISPNSTIAENKVFIPGALLGWDVRFEMTIIDKSGRVIYKTSDRNEPWNGRLNNSGPILDEDVYLWQVTTYDIEGTPHSQHGQINLVK